MARAEHQAPSGGVTPHLTIGERRGQDAIAFYAKAFGAEELTRHLADDGERIMHAHLRINGGDLMLNDDFPEFTDEAAGPPAGIVLHLHVDDADAWWSRAIAAGAQVHMPIADQFWGDRYGQLVDPFGHHWSIGTPLASTE